MADHYRAAASRLDNVENLRDELITEYEGPRRPAVISQLHQDLGRELKVADIHAQLAIVQAIHDLGVRA